MKVKFHGATRTVTGSMHLLEVNGKRILLDCGLFQGRRKNAFERNRNLPFEPNSIDAVVLSHAHIDHSGNLPGLVSQGFRGKIHATPATVDLCEYLLRDSAHIQEEDVRFVNIRRAKQGKRLFISLYRQEDAEKAMGRFREQPYGKAFSPAEGFHVTFYEAGHILGAAIVGLQLQHGKKKTTLVFTGDLGRKGLPIIKDPEQVPAPDYLITESTYGGRFHGPIEDMKKELTRILLDVVDKGGKLVIPAFSVGRTQTLVYFLHQIYDEGRIPKLPVFVDSPLSSNATSVFRKNPDCYDLANEPFLRTNADPFTFGLLTFVKNTAQSKELNRRKDPCIIISASGMCEAGRILHHLRHTVSDKRNTILIVGFQAEHTLGRRLVEKKSIVKIMGDEFKVDANIVTLNGFSAHADGEELRTYFEQMNGTARKTFVVHGEINQAQALVDSLTEIGFADVVIPSEGDEFELS